MMWDDDEIFVPQAAAAAAVAVAIAIKDDDEPQLAKLKIPAANSDE